VKHGTADADMVSGQLKSAGFEEISLRPHDAAYRFGRSLDEAIDLNLALGPAAEALRLAGEDGEAVRPHLEELRRGALVQFVRDDGTVEAQSSTWIVTARTR
jgi:hypothetical protein